MSQARGTALVIGGGIAGLLTARILVNHFQEVIVMERDHFPTSLQARSGVPQGRQLHLLLLKGQVILKKLFPHLEKHLLEKGALEQDYGSQSLYFYRARCSVNEHLPGWQCSRLLLEWQIREELISSYPQVHFLEGCEVNSLWDAGDGSVRGVKFRERGGQAASCQAADLVIDASGASSHAPDWLKELGYKAPEEVLVNAALGYATRYYSGPDGELPWRFISIQGRGGSRSGTLMQIEDGNVVAVLAGVRGDYPGQTDDGYLAFAKSLPDPTIYEILKALKPITPIYGYRRTENRLRHYERVLMPNNFFVMGDAFCSFNPVYGQGITVAALEAQALNVFLQRHRRASSQFHRRIASIVRMPWFLATGVDTSLLKKEMASEQKSQSLPHRYLDRITMLISVDTYVFLTFIKVLHMLHSPLAFLHPRVIVHILLRSIDPEPRYGQK